jgi:hypothetical protein
VCTDESGKKLFDFRGDFVCIFRFEGPILPEFFYHVYLLDVSNRHIVDPAPDDSSTVRQLRTRRGSVRRAGGEGGGRAGPDGGREDSAGNSASRPLGPLARFCADAWSPAEGWMFVEWSGAGDLR